MTSLPTKNVNICVLTKKSKILLSYTNCKTVWIMTDMCTAKFNLEYIDSSKRLFGVKTGQRKIDQGRLCPIIGTIGIWKHARRIIVFAICIDNFGVKYFNKDDVEHLMATRKKYYEISTDWEGKSIADLPWIGTMRRVMWISLCLDT